MSLAVASMHFERADRPQLNVLLPELRINGIFAGIHTAIEFALSVATRLALPVRLIPLGNSPKSEDKIQLEKFISREFNFKLPVSIVSARELPGYPVSADDLWMATHWTTAHSIDVACRLGVLRRESVVYLVQDYEAGFDPWGSSYATARTTYHAGFSTVVNSTPLQRYLQEIEGLEIPDEMVFAPSLDLKRLLETAAARRRSPSQTVLFYARPSKPRNLYDIGVASLSLAAKEVERLGLEVKFVSAGENHPPEKLTNTSSLVPLGKLPWDEYFRMLATADVVLSLQHSPHPSHPPLDAIVSGAFAVTNELSKTRAGLHGRLLVAEPDPQALANQVISALLKSAQEDNAFDASILELFGRPIADVVEAVSGKLKKITDPRDGAKRDEIA